MNRYEGIPEMLELFMEECGVPERWITVHELRSRFQLTRYQCSTVSGFLRRLEFGRFGRCPYTVTRIERPYHPEGNRVCRYLVARLEDHTAVPTIDRHKIISREKAQVNEPGIV